MNSSESPDKLYINELSEVGSQESQTARENDRIVERRLLWKIDLRILPILTLLYVFSAMDRSDIGNAQVAGMQKDIGASSQQWTLVAALFYIGYIVSQPVATLFMRRLNPPNLFAFACCLWGTLTILMLTSKNYQQATALRVLIGLAEGLLQAAPFYLSLWYKITELGTRGAIFFSVASLAGACNGLIAYGLETNFSNAPPFKPWQWLFLIEGIMSVGFSLIVWLLLPPVPENVYFGFTADEKRIAIARSVQAFNTIDAKVNKAHIKDIFKQPFIYFMVIAYSGTIVALSSLTNFLPSIIQGMGYSSVDAQLMTGYILLLAVRASVVGRYVALCIIAAGMYPSVPIVLTWTNVNIIGYTRRATAAAAVNMIAQVFGVVANLLFTKPPYYTSGIAFVVAAMGVAVITELIAIFWLRAQNKKKRVAHATPEAEQQREKSYEDLGNAHPDFFFTI
ncbi:hypothetical protein INT43_003796 [Umbelopsis isabellina]|uniref:Major facilitator superfamily (MFS) profile domain-containing protein n=1 Tax=Mortierella isabellina TaxID=91625 RepID=A0A8H7UI75_MORIS|nr:hypothetical protein INT43_003796 [Umbelopsis isabellina]